MENKVIKQIKTACPFPLLVYKTSVKYNEVRKASGIAFIILDLLLKTGKSNETISNTLLKFGVPTDLHYIFGKEIAGLISTGILEAEYPSHYFLNPKYFSEIKINDINITDKGKKLFKEGAIPTGEEKVKIKDIFFSPVTRKYDVAMSVPFSPLSTSFLGEGFVDKIDIDISGMEDYINSNTTKIGLKTEERAISFETEEPQRMQVRKEEGMTISITEKGVEFLFDTSDETAFFYKYYNSSLMTEMMLLKEKYKFVDAAKNIINVNTVKFEDIVNGVSNIYIPSDIQKQINKPCKIFTSRNFNIVDRDDNVIKLDEEISSIVLDDIDKTSDFALFDSSCIKYYSMVNVEIPCEKFGDIFAMNLLIERVATQEVFENALNILFKHYSKGNYSEDSGKVISYISQALKDSSLLKEYCIQKIGAVNTIDEKIELFQKIASSFSKNEGWEEIYKDVLSGLYQESLNEIKLDNMIYKNTVLEPIRTYLNVSDKDYVDSFVKNVVNTEEDEIVYQALDSVGFSTNLILGVVNIIKPYMDKVLNNSIIESESSLSNKFNNVEINLWKLNDMLGIENEFRYTIKENYDVDDFFNTYSTLTSSVKDIEKYKQYATDEYNELYAYLKIYEPIHEMLAIERTSSSHPERITKKYIDDYISRGKYKDAICDLLVKLQFDLRKMIGNDTMSAVELIDEALKEKLINGKDCHELHQLRICRNGFQHPERSQVKFDKDIINKWKDLVFSIKEES